MRGHGTLDTLPGVGTGARSVHAQYERTLAKMGAWLPYRRARQFLSEFFPLGDDLPWHQTIRRRTMRVGAGLERETLSRAKTPPAVPPSEMTGQQ